MSNTIITLKYGKTYKHLMAIVFMKRIKTKTREVVRIQHYFYCPKCDHEIRGTSVEHVEYNLRLHLDKHKFKKKKK